MPPLFDRSRLKIKPLKERQHDLTVKSILPLEMVPPTKIKKNLLEVAERVLKAQKMGRPIIMMMGGHVLRSGTQNFLIDLMEKNYLTCISMNGSGIIHDYEIARTGATTESVARYIKTGEFGLWKETGFLNDIINNAWAKNPSIGMGEAIGKAIYESNFPYKSLSLCAAAYRLKIPVTVHVGIGYDIIHQHPNCDGAATGALSYNDFLKFTSIIQKLNAGVLMNFGSAVMAPEVYLKALSMARNLANQEDKLIQNFTVLVCDLYDLPKNLKNEAPKDNVGYYFRPWKTMLVRTVKDGGEGFYVRGYHSETLPALWTAISQFTHIKKF